MQIAKKSYATIAKEIPVNNAIAKVGSIKKECICNVN
tara:strand:+ start:695 stop:805 length:111 start_codon:yes stop_codon:yes gene_type:complete